MAAGQGVLIRGAFRSAVDQAGQNLLDVLVSLLCFLELSGVQEECSQVIVHESQVVEMVEVLGLGAGQGVEKGQGLRDFTALK